MSAFRRTGSGPAEAGRYVPTLLVTLLLSLYVVAAATSVRQKSITFDELGHLTGGVSSWLTSDYRLFPQNGQLPQRWATLLLVMSGVRFPPLDQPGWRASDLEAIGYQFLYAAGNDHDAMLWTARLTMIPLGVLLGWVCYAWARSLFGVAAGIVALFIFVFSPSVLAHGPLATSDLAAALMFTTSLACFWIALHRPQPLRVIGSALVMGLLFVTKMSAFLMVPVALTLTIVRIWRGPGSAAGLRRSAVHRSSLLASCGVILIVHVVGIIAVIWASYGFRYTTFRGAQGDRDQMFLGETIDTLAGSDLAGTGIRLAQHAHLLPEPYLFGVAHVLNGSGKLPAFLNGKHSIDGWWYFFPYCWAVKTPLSIFVLLGLAAAAGWRRVRSTRTWTRVWHRLYRLAPLIVFLAVYWTAAMTSSLNLGERHLLPAYPALFILAGAAGCGFGKRDRVATAAVSLLLLLLSIESIGIWPHYLAYFNSIGGGPRSGYRHLVDSSLDWGQDLPGLAQWLKRTRIDSASPAPVYLSYFGSGDPANYRIDARQIHSYQDWRRERPLDDLTGGIYCISATMLQSVYTRARGPWAAPYERAYQTAKREVERLRAMTAESTIAGGRPDREMAVWRQLINDFDELRLARLASYLRRREPDDQIGYSILVFRLSDDEIHRALNGPPVELWPEPQVEGIR